MNIQAGRTLTVNGITANFGSETLRDKSGVSVDLRPQAFAVLRHLAEHSDRLVTKEELIQSVWPGIAVTDDSLVQCVAEIRRAFYALCTHIEYQLRDVIGTLREEGILDDAVVHIAADHGEILRDF